MFVETFWGVETVHRLVKEAPEFHSESTKKGFMVEKKGEKPESEKPEW